MIRLLEDRIAFLQALLSSTLFLSSLIFPASTLFAADPRIELSHVYQLYQKGDYPHAIEAISALKAQNPKDRAILAYWKGLCLSRTQAFDQAGQSFQEAKQFGADFKDLDYELGQALYANQQLKPALEAFQKSAAKKYKTATSTYYVGFIKQLLEDYRSALQEYRTLLKADADPEKVKQAALLQIAELKLSLAQKEQNPEDRLDNLKEKVIPFLERVVNYDPKSPAGGEAQKQLTELINLVKIEEASRFRSGAPIPIKKWIFRINQDLKYDSNVVTRANDSILQVSDAASFFSRTDANAKYDWVLGRRWVFSPEVDAAYTKYTNQTEPFVFQNDNITATAFLKARYEHGFFGAPAAFTLNSELNYFIRDWEFNHTLRFYSRAYNFVASERLPLFGFGGTILSGGLKLFSSEDRNQDALVPMVSLTQNIQFSHGAGLSFTAMIDYNRSKNAFYSRRDYRFITGLNFPQIFAQIDLSFVFDFTLVDTMNQSATRGTEKTLAPSIILARSFGTRFFTNINYGYVNNLSLDQTLYAYSKHVFGFGIGCQL